MGLENQAYANSGEGVGHSLDDMFIVLERTLKPATPLAISFDYKNMFFNSECWYVNASRLAQ